MKKWIGLTFSGIFFIILVFSWFLFSKYIRPNHYQLLRPYTFRSGAALVTTEYRPGKNGSLQIFIPAGEAILGKEPYQTTEYIESFWIDQKPVTIHEYKECFSQGACRWPHYHDDYSKYFQKSIYQWLPVTFVSWLEAEEYCEQAGGHLPTEAQWEKAARGPDGLVLLWEGENQDYQMANLDNFYSFLTPAGWLPKGAGPYGLLDTAGNVREWVIDAWITDQSPVQSGHWTEIIRNRSENISRILKGGSYLDDVAHVRFNYRDSHEANSPGINRGFRCAYEY
ncbi:formylglycine-generating enzyme family protein [Flexilinea flocculi]|jgi:formylglycine-generating enzyme required for sulfatase activity|uniref:Formylglycine-generating enzyme n=1 Tax=Flexilinea flocculi TaxID=1678840 RepID=A0A0S7BWA5_9CHLR|nr:SUMF1/EgtB/PvdO family nonheme iron enzyme [Flexilinea flocculi]GAP40639.1 formylglycine-generating enzyme [Flexilinea flocculi]